MTNADILCRIIPQLERISGSSFLRSFAVVLHRKSLKSGSVFDHQKIHEVVASLLSITINKANFYPQAKAKNPQPSYYNYGGSRDPYEGLTPNIAYKYFKTCLKIKAEGLIPALVTKLTGVQNIAPAAMQARAKCVLFPLLSLVGDVWKDRLSEDSIVVALVLLRQVAVKLVLSPAAPARVTTEDITLAVQACVLGGGVDLLTNL